MQCEEFEDRLNRLLDHRLSPESDELLGKHAADCDDCASLYLAQERLFSGLRAGRVSPPVGLAERVVSQRHLEVGRRQRSWRNAGWAVLLASAASLAGLAWMGLATREPVPPVVKVPKAPVQRGTPGLAIGGLGTRNEAHTASEEKLGKYYDVIENIATQIGDSKEFDEVSESIEPGIKPIYCSFELAFDALRRTLPRGKEARPAKPSDGANWLPELPAIS
jgi:hypothetical protein